MNILTLETIQSMSSSPSFEEGVLYAKRGAIFDLQQIGSLLYAKVQGNTTYQVKIDINKLSPLEAHCTCMSNRFPCKHITGVLITFVEKGPQATIESIDKILEKLSLKNMRKVVKMVLLENPEGRTFITDTLFKIYASYDHQIKKAGLANIYTKMRSILINDEKEYWEHTLEHIQENVQKLLQIARGFITANDITTACEVLEAITSPLLEHPPINYELYEEDYFKVIERITTVWIETLLVQKFSEDEQASWQQTLEHFSQQLLALKCPHTFFMIPLSLLNQTYSHPLFIHAFIDTDERIPYIPTNEDLFLAKVAHDFYFERKEFQKSLRIAQVTDMKEQYAQNLIAMKKINQAILYAKKNIQDPYAFLHLSQLLHTKNKRQQALDLALFGSKFRGQWNEEPFSLISWTYNLAKQIGDNAIAIQFGLKVWQETHAYKSYVDLRELTLEPWEPLKSQLLQDIRNKTVDPKEEIAILLSENLLDDAIQIAETQELYSIPHELITKTTQSNPSWAFDFSIREAHRFIKQGTHKYELAGKMLQKAYFAAINLQKKNLWRDTVEGILRINSRRKSLVIILQDLLERYA